MSQDELIVGKSHIVWRFYKEDYTPATGKPEDCICGAKGDPKAGRLLIPNCPCCDGIQPVREEICNCDTPKEHYKVKAIIPPNAKWRIRYITTGGKIE